MKKPRAEAPNPTLPPALDGLLDGIEDKLLAAKLRQVYRGAASAMESLGYLNLVKYEPDSAEEGPADLDMWEKMAAPVADTIATVNSALHAMRKHFPRSFDELRGPDSETEVGDYKRVAEVESVMRAMARRLSFELDEVRNQLRRPDVVSSRWRLLSELQQARAGFRRQLGDLVFLTANAMSNTQREVVVPGHQADVSNMVSLRSAVADFHRQLSGQRQRLVAGIEPGRVVETVLEDLATLHADGAWKFLPAEVKRALIALRDGLTLVKAQPPDADRLRAQLDPGGEQLAALVTSLTERLDAHDREVWGECSARLRQVELHLSLGANGGPRILTEALEVVESLLGRDSRLDGWIRRAAGIDATKFSEAELREELERFREQLEMLPFH